MATKSSPIDTVSHFAAIRIRLVGQGSLLMNVSSLDYAKTKTLTPLVMSGANRIIPTRLVNFMEQRASFELKTTNIDEKFKISRIVIFVKEVFTSYPGS